VVFHVEFDNVPPAAQTRSMSRWATMVVALLLVSALCTSTLANCMAASAVLPQAQMACCANGGDQCPMHRSESQSAADCCQHDRQRQDELAAAEQQPVHASAVTLEQIAQVPHAAVPAVLDRPIAAHRFGGSSSPPTPRTSLTTVLLI